MCVKTSFWFINSTDFLRGGVPFPFPLPSREREKEEDYITNVEKKALKMNILMYSKVVTSKAHYRQQNAAQNNAQDKEFIIVGFSVAN